MIAFTRKINTLKLPSKLLSCIQLLLAGTAWSESPRIDWDLDDAMRQIGRQANDFSSAMVRVESVTTDRDGNEVSRSTGTGFILKDGRMRYNADDDGIVTLVDRSKVMVFDAEAGQVKEYSLRKHKDRLEPFFRLGFSTTGKDLKSDYLLTILGEERIGDTRALVIELTPKKDMMSPAKFSMRSSLMLHAPLSERD